MQYDYKCRLNDLTTDAGLKCKIIKHKGFISISNQNLNKTLKTKCYSAIVALELLQHCAREGGGCGGCLASRRAGDGVRRLEVVRRSAAVVPAARGDGRSGLATSVVAAEVAGGRGERWRQQRCAGGARLRRWCSSDARGAVWSGGAGRSDATLGRGCRPAPKTKTNAAELKNQ